MLTEYIDGLVLRPLMDGGYTAWRGQDRLGVVQYRDGEVVVEAHDPFVARVLVRRLEADLRAAGVTLDPCASSSQEPRARSGVRSSGFFSRRDTKSAA